MARVVAIGDLEGDYDKFVDMLRTAALIDERGAWIGGEAHLVQLGDVPDRGPRSRRIMDHLMRLEREAERAGGRVHALIGNHEAMNVEGDLRYVHPGEYAAFADRSSARRREAFYRRVTDYLRRQAPADQPPVLDAAFRSQWEAEHPLGFVEHRANWSPRGKYGRWVASHDAVIRIDDTLYLHAGVGPLYAAMDREALNAEARAALEAAPHGEAPSILTAEEGPLWYRGFALGEEAAEAPNLEAVLARHGVARVVIGHTKRASTVLPRFGARVIIADIAVPEDYADPHAFLIVENGAPVTVHRGARVALRAGANGELCAYLSDVAALDPPGSPVARLAEACAAPAAPSPQGVVLSN